MWIEAHETNSSYDFSGYVYLAMAAQPVGSVLQPGLGYSEEHTLRETRQED
jgi:hypothetical protein